MDIQSFLESSTWNNISWLLTVLAACIFIVTVIKSPKYKSIIAAIGTGVILNGIWMRTDFGSPKITIIVAVIVLTIGGIVEWLIHGINNIDGVKRELYVVSLCHWDYHNNSNNTLAIQKMDFKKDG